MSCCIFGVSLPGFRHMHIPVACSFMRCSMFFCSPVRKISSIEAIIVLTWCTFCGALLLEYLEGLQIMGFELDQCLAALLSKPNGSLVDIIQILTAEEQEEEEGGDAGAMGTHTSSHLYISQCPI